MSEVHSLPGWAATLSLPEGDLAATLAARICHDLTSPLGAIANGVELLTLSGAERTPEMELISESVEAASARLRFFRLAYGTAGAQPIGRTEVARTLAALSRSGRVVYDWTPAADHPRAEVRAVFLLLQCLESAMPMGGSLQVSRATKGWEVFASGPRLKIDHPGWDAFGPGPMPPPDGAAHVQFVLLASALHCLGRTLDLDLSSDRIVARF